MSVIIKGKNLRKPHTVRYWVDGKQRERSFATAGEAKDFKIKTDHDVRARIFVDDKSGRENFGEAAQKWLAGLVKSAGTKKVYGNVYGAHVKPAFGDKTLAQVASARQTVSQLLTGPMGHLSHSRRRIALLVIVSVLDEAVKSGKIPPHKITGIELADNGHTADHSDFVFPSHSQLVQLATGLNGHSLTIWLMRGCGLRIGEALAVKKESFRDGGRTLRVTEQVNQTGQLQPLKQRKAGEFRDVPVPGYLREMIQDLPDGYIFGNGDTMPDYKTYLYAFKREAKKAGVTDSFTPHSLRHAFVSALLTRGVAITDVARWVGHKNISVTYGTYGHLIPSAAAKAVSVLDAEYEDWAAEA
jgi:integrase